MPFDGFRRQTLPAIEAYDNSLRDYFNQREDLLSDNSGAGKSGKRKAPASDLMISPNPTSPFPTYQNFRKGMAAKTPSTPRRDAPPT